MAQGAILLICAADLFMHAIPQTFSLPPQEIITRMEDYLENSIQRSSCISHAPEEEWQNWKNKYL
jgi:hypothetical protein